jgi:hypothetical protein
MGEELYIDQYHARVVRYSVARNLAHRFSDVLDEMKHSFDQEVPLVADGNNFCSAYHSSYDVTNFCRMDSCPCSEDSLKGCESFKQPVVCRIAVV